MTEQTAILNQYIERLTERRIQVATLLLNDASPPDLQVDTAAKNANKFVQIQAGIEAAQKALHALSGQPTTSLKDTIPIAPLD